LEFYLQIYGQRHFSANCAGHLEFLLITRGKKEILELGVLFNIIPLK